MRPTTRRRSALVIWLLRHGDADYSGPDDDSRKLTERGWRQAENAGKALAALGVALDACLTSPTVRARDTAQAACRELGVEPEVVSELRKREFGVEALAAGPREILLVGHKPSLQRAIQVTTGGRVRLSMGGLVAISAGELCQVLTPAGVEMLARGRLAVSEPELAQTWSP